MADKKNDKILLIEHDKTVGERVELLLTQAGYEVRWVNSSYAAIAALESSVASPFTLIISAYKIPRTSGDDLLEHARFIVPDTQRMLFANASEIDALINGINRAAIHSCIVIPFEDEQFMSEVARRCEQFRQSQKRESLKKLTEHQNRQMYNIAVNLKKKKMLFEQQISEKKNTIKRLASGNQFELPVEHKNAFTLAAVASDFRRVSDNLKLFCEDIAFDGMVELKEIDDITLAAIVDRAAERSASEERGEKRMDGEVASDEFDRALIDNMLNLFFQHELSGYCRKGTPQPSHQELTEPFGGESEKSGDDEQPDSDRTKEIDKDGSSKLPVESEPLDGATFIPPIEPSDAQIRYFFHVNHRHNGKKESDGARDSHGKRGRAFVLNGALLAEKYPSKNGVAGRDTSGNPIPVAEPKDLLFNTGANTRFSEDNLKIFATAEGQPHLDVMGTVSVFPEMHIQGDVDHETGNLSFGGNIVVNGSVKRGVKVRCANLTVEAVEGAELHLTGDLDVSSGIINSDVINVQGDVQARYVNNSRVKALGDVIVQREIIDSELFAGGRCINSAGLIISSFINARRGVVAGRIGTEKAAPSKLEVGTEGIIAMMIADLDERIEKNREKIRELQDEILSFESEEKILHGRISGAAYIHDRANIELRGIEKQLPQVEASEDLMEVKRLFKTVKELKSKADASEKIIFEAFERQDLIVGMVMAKQREIETLENQILSIRLKQRGIEEFSRRSQPEAEVRVSGQIMSGTLVTGVRSKLLLKTDRSGCRIHEVAKGVDMVQNSSSYGALYEMVVSSYRRSA